MNILFLDDEPEILEIFCLEVQEEFPDVSLECASNGLKGIEKCKVMDFDLIFTDARMPQMDGLKFCETIKKSHPHTKIYLITGHYSPVDIKKPEFKNFEKIIQKPIDFDSLFHEIKKTICDKNL